ncbi:MAG: hypothetical protein GY751_09610 [Bacteroidetes bacterium]|nr:hypothetical protein [Bacteroidota bacterium]
MKRQYVLGLLSGVLISGVVAVNAGQENHTIESCGKLLPEGQKFEIDINGTIDTSSSDRKFDGSFGLSDGTQIQYSDDQKKAVNPFVECVAGLLK